MENYFFHNHRSVWWLCTICPFHHLFFFTNVLRDVLLQLPVAHIDDTIIYSETLKYVRHMQCDNLLYVLGTNMSVPSNVHPISSVYN